MLTADMSTSGTDACRWCGELVNITFLIPEMHYLSMQDGFVTLEEHLLYLDVTYLCSTIVA